MKAKNADLIMQYAVFAQEIDKPWLMFESRSVLTLSRKIGVDIERKRSCIVDIPPYSMFTDWSQCKSQPCFDSKSTHFRVIGNGTIN